MSSSDPTVTNASEHDRLAGSRALAARLPDLLVTARRIAASVMYGVHGRRRPGPGETFWQFRQYVAGEPAKRIDWRRSARDRHLYVREREWEAAQTVWLYADLSPSMNFRSSLAEAEKADRAVVLLLALAELLARGGERVGMPGLAPARIGRDAADRLAAALAVGATAESWPRMDSVKRFSELVVLSDFLDETDLIADGIRRAANRGAGLHLLQIFDPAEESFPYDGRLEFQDPETGQTWLAERAGTLQDDYRNRLQAHRNAITTMARHAGFTFGLHHTDVSAAQGLLFLYKSLTDSGHSVSAALAANPGAAA